jgi:hypothetical protein
MPDVISGMSRPRSMGVIEKEKIAALLFRRLDSTEDEAFLYSGLREKEKGIILVLIFGDDIVECGG